MVEVGCCRARAIEPPVDEDDAVEALPASTTMEKEADSQVTSLAEVSTTQLSSSAQALPVQRYTDRLLSSTPDMSESLYETVISTLSSKVVTGVEVPEMILTW